MKRAALIVGAVLAVTAATVAPLELTSSSGPPATVTLQATAGVPSPGTFISPPSNGGNLNCGANMSGKLSTFLNGLPAGSTVTFPHDGCYTISSSITIANQSGLTINGNGATFNAWPPNTFPPDLLQPIIFVQRSSNITVNDVNVVGSWDGHAGTGGPCACIHGQNVEGSVGVMIQATAGFTMKNSAIVGTQGDCFSVQIPTTGAANGTNLLNTNVVFSNNQENFCGYTSASIESVAGMTFSNNVLTNGAARLFSFEVDGASTSFHNQTAPPGFAAANNVSITGNTLQSVTAQPIIDDENGAVACTTTPCHPTCPGNGGAFQTQTSGVCTYYSIQQQGIYFLNNTIKCQNGPPFPNACPLANVIGANPANPPPSGQTRAQTQNFTIAGNLLTKGFASAVSGGSGCTPDSGSTMYFTNVTNVQVNNNTIPVVTATAGTGCGGAAYLSAVQVAQTQGASSIAHNNFTGASSSLNSHSTHTRGLSPCSNIYGATGGSSDPAC